MGKRRRRDNKTAGMRKEVFMVHFFRRHQIHLGLPLSEVSENLEISNGILQSSGKSPGKGGEFLCSRIFDSDLDSMHQTTCVFFIRTVFVLYI